MLFRTMNNNWPAFVMAIFFIPAVLAFSQERKGTFIDGEFVEDYVYSPDFMTPEELKKHIEERSPDVVIVDTAPTLIWEEEHIPGAISFPWKANIAPPVPLPRDKTLVIYCACNDHEDSTDIARQLSVFGYQKIKVLKGGWFKWLELGYKTVSKDEEKVPK